MLDPQRSLDDVREICKIVLQHPRGEETTNASPNASRAHHHPVLHFHPIEVEPKHRNVGTKTEGSEHALRQSSDFGVITFGHTPHIHGGGEVR